MRRAPQGESAQRQDGQTQGLWSHPNGPFGIQGACAEPGRPVGRVPGSVTHWTRPEPPLQVRARRPFAAGLRRWLHSGWKSGGAWNWKGRKQDVPGQVAKGCDGGSGRSIGEAPPSWCCWIRSLEAGDLTAL